jgi:hypothetical protein
MALVQRRDLSPAPGSWGSWGCNPGTVRCPLAMARAALILSAALAFIASTSSARVFPAFASPAFRSPLPSVQLSHMRGGSGERMRTQSPAMTSAKIELQDPVAPEPGDTSNVPRPIPFRKTLAACRRVRAVASAAIRIWRSIWVPP